MAKMHKSWPIVLVLYGKLCLSHARAMAQQSESESELKRCFDNEYLMSEKVGIEC